MPNESVKERRVDAYLQPCNDTFLRKYAKIHEISNSRAVNEAVKALRACQPPDQLERILSKNNY